MGIRDWAARRRGSERGLPGGPLAVPMLLSGIALGAGLMYVLNPRRPRAKVLHGVGEGRAPAACAGRGVVEAPFTEPAAGERETADQALARQVRIEVERVVAHPERITVAAANGIVTLEGTLPVGELKPLLRRVADVRGIELIENRLDVVD